MIQLPTTKIEIVNINRTDIEKSVLFIFQMCIIFHDSFALVTNVSAVAKIEPAIINNSAIKY